MEAHLTITGHVGGAVDFGRTQPTGVSRATFRMACTPRVRRQQEWSDLPTTWVTVVCWRSLAEHVTSSFGKGDPVIVVGRLRTQEWTDAEGHQHNRMVIDATTAGHDLNRGTAAFRKIQRSSESQGDGAADPAEEATEPQPVGPADQSIDRPAPVAV